MNPEQLKSLKALVGQFVEMEKALRQNPVIRDLYDDYHSNAAASESPTGPREEASGRGAEHMLTQYSNFDAQEGLTKQYEDLAAHFSGRLETMKASVEAIQESVEAIATKLSKSEEQSVATAEVEVEKALRQLGRAEAAADEEEISKAKQNVDNAKIRVQYLRAQSNGTMTDDLRQRFEELPSMQKASLEERFEALSDRVDALGAQIAKANDAHDAGGRFADKSGDKTDSEDEDKEKDKEGKETSKAETPKDSEESELRKSFTNLKGQLAELASRLDSQSAGKGSAPALAKSKDKIALVKSQVAEALSSDEIPEVVETEARRLSQQLEYVEQGLLSETIFNQTLEKSLPQTQALFTVSADS